MTPRDKYNWGFGSLAVLFAAYSLCHAVDFAGHLPKATPGNFERLIVAVWALAPPIFLWIDWVCFRPAEEIARKEAQHTHDLARNIWLGLVGILVGVFGFKPFS